MTSIASATTWGSLSAVKHALLIHGLTSSSHTWHRVAPSLAARGYLVTAPNIIGHASRVSPDYRLSAIAEDLRPYVEARNYSLIIGHSLGAVTVLHLLPYLSRSHPTALILVDPPMSVPTEGLDLWKSIFADACTNVKTAETETAENPLWTREDGVYRELATRLCDVDAMRAIMTKNRPWNFLHRFIDVSEPWKASVLLADPSIVKLCPIEDLLPYPHIRPVVVPGAGHWIQSEFPEAIVEEALKRVDELDVVRSAL